MDGTRLFRPVWVLLAFVGFGCWTSDHTKAGLPLVCLQIKKAPK